jgi:hypothetical protein
MELIEPSIFYLSTVTETLAGHYDNFQIGKAPMGSSTWVHRDLHIVTPVLMISSVSLVAFSAYGYDVCRQRSFGPETEG